ncbi:MAG TPA: AIM24 family protein, partial [Thermoleophilia bacterium]|nr:AIM24 family protein [Thermoleophilia bacterium]
IQGKGSVLVHGSGDFHRQQLREGESVLVSTGNLAAFSEELDYDIKRVSGARRILFGGEGLFMTRLTGPGLVYLQSLKRDT